MILVFHVSRLGLWCKCLSTKFSTFWTVAECCWGWCICWPWPWCRCDSTTCSTFPATPPWLCPLWPWSTLFSTTCSILSITGILNLKKDASRWAYINNQKIWRENRVFSFLPSCQIANQRSMHMCMTWSRWNEQWTKNVNHKPKECFWIVINFVASSKNLMEMQKQIQHGCKEQSHQLYVHVQSIDTESLLEGLESNVVHVEWLKRMRRETKKCLYFLGNAEVWEMWEPVDVCVVWWIFWMQCSIATRGQV